MRRAVMILCATALLASCAAPKDPHAFGYDDLPDPPINLFRVVPTEALGSHMTRSHGVVEFRLSGAEPSRTFWNDPDTRKDPWGTVTLERIEEDGTVVMQLDGKSLRAKAGKAFPGTGIVVIDVNPAAETVLMRSRFTRTEAGERPSVGR